MSTSGLDVKPMSRVQMAYKIKEAMDNVEDENLPLHLALDRDYIEYLQKMLYRLMDEFRQELVLVGATAAQLKSSDEATVLDKYIKMNAGSPVKTEHRYAKVGSRKDTLLENENGLRLRDGYNLRVRAYPWATIHDMATLSATPEFRLTDSGNQLFFEELAAKFSVSNLELTAGRSAMWWGPGYHGSMLLSNNAKPLDLVRFQTIKNFRLPWGLEKIGSFGVDFFVSQLEKDRTVQKPKFGGLRLEYSPLRCLTLSANRTAIFGGKGRPKLHFHDYMRIFTGTNDLNQDTDKNNADQLASFGARLAIPLRPEARIASGVELYGEWAGEDKFAPWENESPGFLTGMFLTDVLNNDGTDLRVEYAKNKSGWYNHGIYDAAGTGTAYTYKGEIIGHHMGGDADDLFLRLSKEVPFLTTPFFNFVKVGAQLDLERHGISLDVTEKRTQIVADITWCHFDAVLFALRYEFEDYRDFGYESGKRSQNNIFLTEVDFKF
ncbi:MAG: hypothetical protein NTV07_00180 [Candidatus Omnitrophica bacterium]|nr:hypothetical protein [Candidatus Omnitrophota bacterium]